MPGFRLILTAFILFVLYQPLMKESVAGIIVENGRITSWTLDTEVAGLGAGTVISFALGTWNDLPVTPSTATMPWWGTSPVDVFAPTPDTDAANLRDALKNLAATSGDQSLLNDTYANYFTYYEFNYTGGGIPEIVVFSTPRIFPNGLTTIPPTVLIPEKVTQITPTS